MPLEEKLRLLGQKMRGENEAQTPGPGERTVPIAAEAAISFGLRAAQSFGAGPAPHVNEPLC